jgi:hypothetical protein
MWQAIKNTVLWNYGRTAWQYDVLCILILAFIFLTPKSWFEGKGREPLPSEAIPKLTRLVVGSDNFSPDSDEATRLRRVRELSGNENAAIAAWRERRDANGKIIYEIDLR